MKNASERMASSFVSLFADQVLVSLECAQTEGLITLSLDRVLTEGLITLETQWLPPSGCSSTLEK